VEDFAMKTGHIGIYVSSKSQKEFVPKICSWLKERDELPTKKTRSRKTRSGSGSKKAPSKKAEAKKEEATASNSS
jgi:hypothetical protein